MEKVNIKMNILKKFVCDYVCIYMCVWEGEGERRKVRDSEGVIRFYLIILFKYMFFC